MANGKLQFAICHLSMVNYWRYNAGKAILNFPNSICNCGLVIL